MIFLDYLGLKIRLFVKIWYYPVWVRILLAKIFAKSNRYSKKEILENIYLSEKIKKSDLVLASPLPDRYEVIKQSIKKTKNIRGILAEFGVFKGKTLEIIKSNVSNEDLVYGFDSFNGLPENWGEILPKGFFKTSIPKIKEKNVKLVVGDFKKTIPQFHKKKKIKYRLVHIDCDLYDSTILVLKYIVPRLSIGSVIIFDEYYGYPDFENHEFKAFKDYLTKNKIRSFIPIFYSSHSVGFKVTD